jgi:hypothetical protein
MSSSRFILAEPERAAALSGNRDIRVRLHRIGSAGGTCAHARGANTAAKQALDVAGTSIKRSDVLFSQQTFFGELSAHAVTRKGGRRLCGVIRRVL